MSNVQVGIKRAVKVWFAGWVILILLAFSALVAGGCSSGKTQLKVLNAGSLMVPFAALEEAFEATHPDVDIQIEGHGSIQVIRHVTELHDETDIVAVADHALIPMMMYHTPLPGGEKEGSYADWYVKFATNRLGIAYTASSKYADQINTANWYQILARDDVTVGISDPRFDSAGYRSLMMCQLAELYYGDENIFDGIMGEFKPAMSVVENDGSYTIEIPEILRPGRLALRGTSIGLLATIQSGDIDYAFLYKSVAEQYGLDFVEVPSEIDLSSADYAKSYGQVQCRLSFQRFASVDPEFVGQPIIYGITVPRNAPHPELASEFIAFILSPEGQEILAHSQQPTLIPAAIDQKENIPSELKLLLTE